MIDYNKISAAIEYYKSKNYKYIEVPWAIEERFIDQTIPPNAKKFKLKDKFLVGSAEQSFLELAHYNKIEKNNFYIAVTPCFRDEVPDDIHQEYFMKAELIYFGVNLKSAYEKIFKDAFIFFRRYVNSDSQIFSTSIKYDEDKDLNINDIEVGSYYIRNNYTCGTAIAEPRLTYAIERIKK